MIKSLAAVCSGFLISLVLSAQDPVDVRMTVPSIVEAGQEFLVSIALDKGNLEEFSRFQQEIPAGLTVIQENSGTADYSFENQRVRFIWLKLPADPSINLTYRIQVNERLKGTFTLAGEFSYVEVTERKSVTLDPEIINITPSPQVTADKQISIASFATTMAAERAEMNSSLEITCIRQTPYMSRTGNDILVNLLVYKKDMNKFAKIEETIPEGFEARSMESRDGLFTFKDNIAKFVWMNLPEVSGFIISYRLIPNATVTIDGLDINGILSYIVEGRNVDVEITQKDIDLSDVTDQNVESMLAAIEKGETMPVEKQETQTQTEKPTPPPVTEKPVVKETSPVTRPTTSSRIPASQLLAVRDGLYFRVQIAATRRFSDANITYSGYNLSRPVKVESQEGWYKYTIGSFTTYQQARDFKNTMISKGLSGAFVVAYRSGVRMDMMDALQMSGGQ